MVKIITFVDPADSNMRSTFVVETERTEEELQKIAEEIRNRFEQGGFEDWSYTDILEEMERQGTVKTVESKDITIYL